MSQKPVDTRSQLTTRVHLWQVMRELGSFTATEVTKHTLYHLSTVKSYLKGLVAANIITLDGTTYTIDPETAPYEPPRVREDGSVVTQGMGRHNMWRTMKMNKEFTIAFLVGLSETASVKIAISEAEYYCEYLCKAGYISLVEGASLRAYRFNSDRYTGPKAPMIQKILNVFDQNTGKVVWQSGKGGNK